MIQTLSRIALCALCALCGACSSPNVSEVGSAVGGSYTNPKTGEAYAGNASSYVKFNGNLTGNFQPKPTDPKQVLPLSYSK